MSLPPWMRSTRIASSAHSCPRPSTPSQRCAKAGSSLSQKHSTQILRHKDSRPAHNALSGLTKRASFRPTDIMLRPGWHGRCSACSRPGASPRASSEVSRYNAYRGGGERVGGARAPAGDQDTQHHLQRLPSLQLALPTSWQAIHQHKPLSLLAPALTGS